MRSGGPPGASSDLMTESFRSHLAYQHDHQPTRHGLKTPHVAELAGFEGPDEGPERDGHGWSAFLSLLIGLLPILIRKLNTRK